MVHPFQVHQDVCNLRKLFYLFKYVYSNNKMHWLSILFGNAKITNNVFAR